MRIPVSARPWRLALILAALALTAHASLLASRASAQFGSPVIDGVINAGEYGVHTNGQNQQTSGGSVWYMTWDDTYLYVALANANLTEGAILYIDKDPALPANGGGAGNTNGQLYDSVAIVLPFRADFVAYFKAGYRECRTGNGGSWSSPVVGCGSYAEGGGNTRELSIPWSQITSGAGRPAAFNHLAYATSASGYIYAQVPAFNPGPGFIASGTLYPRFYSVLSTVDAASTKPFSRDTIERNVGPGAFYATLKAAFDAINNGALTGTVNLYVTANTTESNTAALNASGSGSANYASVTIRPSGGTRKVGGDLAAPLVYLNGADNVTFDGRIGGTGSTRSLILENLNTAVGRAIEFINDATNNAVRYSILTGASNSAPTGVVYFNGTTGPNGNDDNTIENNEIGPSAGTPQYAIYSAGATAQNSNIRILNNDIHDWWHASQQTAGLYVASNNDAWTVSGNSFYQTAARSLSGTASAYAIYITPGAGVFTVSGNYIGGSAPLAGGSPMSITANRFYGVLLQASASLKSSIQGNTLTNFSMTTTQAGYDNSSWRGIYTGSAADIIGNTIGSGTATGAVVMTSQSNGPVLYGILAAGGAECNIQNNVIGGITAAGQTPAVSANFRGIYVSGCAPTISHNTVGSATTANSVHASSAATGVDGTGQRVEGIHSASSQAAIISNNTVANLTNSVTASSGLIKGIELTTSVSPTITDNTVRNLSASSKAADCAFAPVIGIDFNDSNATSGLTIARNMAHSLTATEPTTASCVTGMAVRASTAGPQTISGNVIHSLRSGSTLTAQVPAAMTGIYVGQTNPNLIMANNRVRLGIDAAGNAITNGYGIVGIYADTAARGGFYHNSVFLGGTGVNGTAGVPTAALRSLSLSLATFTNNLWVNARSNATGAAIHSAAHFDDTSMATNYNLFYAPASATLIRLGSSSPTNYPTVAAWTAASGGKDVNSLSADPLFVNATGDAGAVDLHINAASPTISPAEGGGTPVGAVTTDFDGETRSATASDLGADEFTPTGTQLNTTYNSITVPAGQTYTLTADTTINRGLTLDGLLNVGAATLTLGPDATLAGGPFSATNMILTDGGGQVCRRFTALGAFTYPLGDNTGTAEYSPATLNFTSGTFAAGAQACATVTNAAHPNVDAANYPTYLTRYWTVTQTGISSFSANTSFTYMNADVVVGSGQSESALGLWKFTAPSAWTVFGPTDATNNLLSGTTTSFSDFTGRSVSPLAVRLAGFSAEATAGGQVTLTWETVTEQDNAGFNIYRGESEVGPWVQANAALIPAAAPGSTEGRSYRWTDSVAQPGTTIWYLLEDLDLSGTATRHGPVSVRLLAPNAVRVTGFAAAPDWLALVRNWLKSMR